MDKSSAAATIVFICLIGYVFVVVYNFVEIKAYNPLVVFPALFAMVGIIVLSNWGDLFEGVAFIRAPPLFITESGVVGRLVCPLEPLPGGYLKAVVVFNRGMLKSSHVGSFVDGFVDKLAMLTTATVTVEVRGHTSQFVKIDDRDCENQNGAWRYVGRLDGAELHNPVVSGMQAELRRLSDKLGLVVTSMKVYGQDLYSLVNQRQLDIKVMSNELKMIAENMKNVKVITKGGSSGAVEALADEL